MNTKKIITELSTAFLFSVLIFGVLFVSISTYAALNQDTAPARNGLEGGAFMYWIQEILLPDTLPSKNKKFLINTKLEGATVKKSRRIADSAANTIATATDGKIGIGTDTPTELLEISGNSPRMVVSSIQNNPYIKVIAKNKSGKIYFDNDQKKIVFAKGNDDIFSVGETGDAKVKGEIYEKKSEKKIIVIHAGQKCAPGSFVEGFDEKGNIQCR